MSEMIFSPIALKRECRIRPAVLSEMRARSTIGVNDEICSLLTKIRELKDEIIAFMESGEHADISCEKGLINLRRDIYNERFSRILKFNAGEIENEVLREKVTLLRGLISEMKEKEALKEEMWKKEYTDSVDLIRDTMQNESFFYDSIKHIGFTMYDKLHKYCGLPASEHKSTQKKGNIPFIKLITRSALKPSPFASFVSVKPMIVNGESKPDEQEGRYLSCLYLNEVILLRIYAGLLELPEIIRASEFALNDKVFQGNGFCDIAYEKDNPNNNKVFGTKATFSRIPLTENIRRLYDHLRENGKADLGTIAGVLGCSEDNAVLFVKKAEDVGLIRNVRMIESDSPDTLGDIILSIDHFFSGSAAAMRIRELLLETNEHIKAYNSSFGYPKTRIELYKKICGCVREMYSAAGINEEPANIVYEDLVDTSAGSLKVPEELKRDLGKLCRLSNIFDINYRIQLYFAERFRERFGDAEVPYNNAQLMMLLTECNQRFGDMWVHEWDTSVSRGLCPAIDRLDDLKDRFHSYLTDHKDDERIEISDELLDEMYSSVSDICENRHFSNDIFYQQCSDGRIVINNLYPGYMTFFGRHIDYFRDPEYRALADGYIKAVEDMDDVTEIYEVYGFNANRHEPIFSSVLAFDDDKDEKYSRLGFRNVVKKSNIVLRYDHETGVVGFYENGRKRNFKEIGSLVTFLMKGEHSFVHNLCTNVFTYPQMFKAFEPASGKITPIPEISYKNIIISRKGYILNTNIIPPYDKTRSETENYFALRKWFSDNGMPMKFFIKRYLDSPESIDPTKEKTDYSINKPQYIDLDNIILYQLFEKIRLNDVVCIISECQPDIPENENVSEYIVEVTQ